MSSNDDKYPEPEGWGDDGFWRDPAIDSDYETGLTSPVRPAPDGPREDPGYSYWADGKGWENSPGAGGVRAPAAPAAPARGRATPRRSTRRAAPIRPAVSLAAVSLAAARAATGRRRRPDRLLRRGRRPDGCLPRRAGWSRRAVLAAWWSRRPGRSWRAWRARPARRPAGQAQGRLVAALDLEEGARRRRQRVRAVHPLPGRRLLLPRTAPRRSRPRSSTPSSSPRPSTTATAPRSWARSAPRTGRT